jgi:hypothetical protein
MCMSQLSIDCFYQHSCRISKQNDVCHLYVIILPVIWKHQQRRQALHLVDEVNIKPWLSKTNMSSECVCVFEQNDCHWSWPITRVQPESSSAMSNDDSKSTVDDSVMIDNQADYDRIFRGKARLPRSPSQQVVSSQVTATPGSSTTGFPVQTISSVQTPSSVVTPSKSSHSVSPPPQVRRRWTHVIDMYTFMCSCLGRSIDACNSNAESIE